MFALKFCGGRRPDAMRRCSHRSPHEFETWRVIGGTTLATDLMHDAIMIMYFKKYDKLGRGMGNGYHISSCRPAG
jgi:hypothetical protein